MLIVNCQARFRIKMRKKISISIHNSPFPLLNFTGIPSGSPFCLTKLNEREHQKLFKKNFNFKASFLMFMVVYLCYKVNPYYQCKLDASIVTSKFSGRQHSRHDIFSIAYNLMFMQRLPNFTLTSINAAPLHGYLYSIRCDYSEA
jgi:hypothetical protein